MFPGEEYLLPLAWGAVVVAVTRYVSLLIALILTLRGSPKAKRLEFFQVFAGCLGVKPRRNRHDTDDQHEIT